MGVYEELFKKDKTIFERFSYRDWCDYYTSLNEELPPEKCHVKLTDNEKECYLEDLERIKQERAKHPGVPIDYDMPKYSWFE